jgi:hypothetical protein
MAKKNIQDTSQNKTNSFVKGLNKDADPTFIGEGMWSHARNAVNNTLEGNIGTLSNEVSNVFCAEAGATLTGKKYIIGTIHLYTDKWIIFTVAHPASGVGAATGCEIGLFEEETCRYRIIVQDLCLNFDKQFLITGASREKEDCSWSVYFADGRNPDRYLNVGDDALWPTPDYIWIGSNTYANGSGINIQWPGVQWDQECKDENGIVVPAPGGYIPVGCIICKDLTTLNCEALRLARLMDTPTIQVIAGIGGGVLRNGSYFATLAYTIKGQRVTDYFSPSNTQPIWNIDDVAGCIDVLITADSTHFDEFELVVIQIISQGAVAKRIGLYSTSTSVVHLDQIKDDLITIPIEMIPLRTPVYETSDQITEVNTYLLRIAPRSKFDFNYQPLANQIRSQWVSVEYPADYYVKGGSNTSYLRDEVYAFFIRWVYTTGDKSSSYHIPGRAPTQYLVPNVGTMSEIAPAAGNINALNTDDRVFEVCNTATITSSPGTVLPDGGIIRAQGNMGYWESTEKYPDNRHDIWDSSSQCWSGTTDPQFDLCAEPIRHHKFPDNITANSDKTNHYSQGGANIRLMGVTFTNILLPKDNDGNDIPGIAGYEILRGSREGNRSVIAKGMINNMRTYNIKGNEAIAGRQGLYPNYPFNTIKPLSSALGGNVNNFNDPYIKLTNTSNPSLFQNTTIIDQLVPTDMITFHSPDTNFRKPFLSMSEVKTYGALTGTSNQYFQEPDKQPKSKLLADAAVFVIFIAGVIEAVVSNTGKTTINLPKPLPGSGASDILAGAGASGVLSIAGSTAVAVAEAAYNTAMKTYYTGSGAISDAFSFGVNPILSGINATYITTVNAAAATGGTLGLTNEYSRELPKLAYLGLVGIGAGVQQTLFYFLTGADTALRLIYALLPYRQFALQSISYGFYKNYQNPLTSQPQRFNIADSFYLEDNIQNVKQYIDSTGTSKSYIINNLLRQTAVTLRTTNASKQNVGPNYILNPSSPTGYADTSLVTLGTAIQAGIGLPVDMTSNKTNVFNLSIASHYAGLKVRLRNQYGQLDSLKEIPITPSEQKLNYNSQNIPAVFSSFWCTISTPYGTAAKFVTLEEVTQVPILFGGDVYINRYTEKNNMFFFYDWLYGEPDGYEYNYILKHMIAEPRFWMNSEQYDMSHLKPSSFISPTPGSGPFPTDFYNLDYYVKNSRKYDYSNDTPTGFPDTYPGVLGAKESYFYLANSSVRDFFVESDVIVDFRQPGLETWEKNYDTYTYSNLAAMFNINPDTITRGNYYAYDYSLSISKIFTQYFSQGNLQSRYYNPNVSQLCYTYYPDRVVYSLPQQNWSTKDSWFVYLVNNFHDFKNRITSIKPYAKTGMFITFYNASPLMYQGVDTLTTELGTKLTIGDGGLFANPSQNITISDVEYEYGSSQNKFGVIGTPAGMYYISQNQGRIFSFEQGLKEISQAGMKWWFSLFLPYKLTEDFPEYPHTDNPVAGIGTQAVYDNYNGVIFFCKKDYKLKPEYANKVTYFSNGDYFLVNGLSKVELGNPLIFDDASWTMSFDPKNEFWISFHDWHPDFVLPARQYFLTTKGGKLWKHNAVCNSYCNFYGIPQPFEVEIPLITGQTVTTLKSIEYILECYKNPSNNCVDQFQVLDYNFDKAVIYNAEQVSGYLNLNIFPKNNITLANTYPIINFTSIDVLFSKEENKYRFNQFWDITKNRGEFPIGSNYPPTGPLVPGTTVLAGSYNQETIWATQSNGYIKTLTPANLDYNKTELQRKKFRNYLNFLYLSRTNSQDVNMIIKFSNSKNQISQR